MKKQIKKKQRKAVLSHHSLTGQRLHRHHTSYPVLALILIVVGIFFVNITMNAVASNDITVTATVPGPPPTDPAVIDDPINNSTLTSHIYTVKGTCAPYTIVRLYRNDIFAGAALCGTGTTWQIDTTLFRGKNVLVPRIFNGIDLEGPAPTPVTVTYDTFGPEFPTTTTPSSSDTLPGVVPVQASEPAPLILTSENPYKGYYIGDTITWPVEITGGVAPYAVQVDWGDGKTDVISRPQAGKFDISHIYKTAGVKDGNIPIKIKITDAQGNEALLQLAVIVNSRDGTVVNVPLTSAAKVVPTSLFFSWQAYGVAVVMVFTFWLGEQREYELIKSQFFLKRIISGGIKRR